MKLKLVVILLVFIGLYSCLEPFDATVGDNASSILVVDGLISNKNAAHSVKLTRSVANIDEHVFPVTDALVIIEDDLGLKTALAEIDSGRYETDTCNFHGVPGRIYTLYIKTKEGEEYRSTPCLMKPSSHIDSVFIVPGKDLSSETDRQYNGVAVYVSGNVTSDEIKYLRWSYKEDWKFSVPFYPDEVPSPDGGWEEYSSNKDCWKSAISSNVLLYSFNDQTGKSIIGKELYFLNSQTSDRLINRYSTLIEQYSISKEEYEFWRKLEQSTTGVGNIFGEQPFSITGNIKNINNPDEDVLGYFQVAGYTSERIYIDYSQIYDLRLPIKNSFHACQVDSFLIKELNKIAIESGTPIFKNMYDIYNRFVLNEGSFYRLAYPIYNESGIVVIGLGLSTQQCTDCSLSGDTEKPDYWKDEY
jgi:hypothetical protein